MQLNYIASLVFGVLAVVLLFAFAVYFNRPNIAPFAVLVAATAWAACWLGAAGEYAQHNEHHAIAAALSMASFAATVIAVMFFLIALKSIS